MEGALIGLFGVLISLYFSYKLHKDNQKFQKELVKQQEFLQHRNKKYELLIDLVSYRFDPASYEFSRSINGIPAVFYDSKNVVDATKDFHRYKSASFTDDEITNDKLLNIYYEIFKDLSIEEHVDKNFLYQVFNGRE